jgi:hypothetical protein
MSATRELGSLRAFWKLGILGISGTVGLLRKQGMIGVLEF